MSDCASEEAALLAAQSSHLESEINLLNAEIALLECQIGCMGDPQPEPVAGIGVQLVIEDVQEHCLKCQKAMTENEENRIHRLRKRFDRYNGDIQAVRASLRVTAASVQNRLLRMGDG